MMVTKQRKPTATAVKRLAKMYDKYMVAREELKQEFGVSDSYVNGLLNRGFKK